LAQPWLTPGTRAFERRNHAYAIEAYEHALAINPNHRDSRFNLALALRQRDHLRDAARELETLLTQNKSDLPTLFQLGELYSGPLQRPVRTREIYQQIIQRHPEAIEASTARRWMQANP
jgi:tetratricopeptide (TPR) repeat protein